MNVFAAYLNGNLRINTSVGASGTDTITTLISLRISTLPLEGTSAFSLPLTLQKSSSRRPLSSYKPLKRPWRLSSKRCNAYLLLCSNTKRSCLFTAWVRFSGLSSSPRSVTLPVSRARNPWSHLRALIHLPINRDRLTINRKPLPNAAPHHCVRPCFK